MSGGNVKELEPVALFGVGTDYSLSATALAPIGVQGQAFKVALVRNGNDTIFLGNQVLDVEVL